MKKCPDCKKEIDRYGAACEYCGKVVPMKEGYEIEHRKKLGQEKKK